MSEEYQLCRLASLWDPLLVFDCIYSHRISYVEVPQDSADLKSKKFFLLKKLSSETNEYQLKVIYRTLFKMKDIFSITTNYFRTQLTKIDILSNLINHLK